MTGIIGYGAYVPYHRLGASTNGWGQKTEKAVANYDEDSLTMAVAAGRDCLSNVDRSQVDALFFASTTHPYAEKQVSPLIAAALDLRRDVLTFDLANSLRSGTLALRAALDMVKSGSIKQALVVAADIRLGKPRSVFETSFGEGAAALLVGSSKPLATIEDSYSISDDVLDLWRSPKDGFVRSWEDRFAIERGYARVVREAVAGILQKHKLTPKDFQSLVLYAPDARRHAEMVRTLGFDPKTQVPDAMFNVMGNTGTAFAPMLLISALEKAKAGDRMLLVNYGNGADALIVRVTDAIGSFKPKLGVAGHIQSKKIVEQYNTYLQWRGLLEYEPPMTRPADERPAATALLREEAKVFRLHGSKCLHCGNVQYPKDRVCIRCGAKDKFEDYKLSDRQASITSYSMEYVHPTLDPPMVVTILNFEGGGRLIAEMTDRDISKVKVGMPVEMTFRKLNSVESINNYYWKCAPPRDQAGERRS
ncbi:MAG: 3-oxoacyl-[acyl-carrier-protein] synthase III C-terminal domain-containing protein [Dehalococcoidia bacterium]|nr:3-oxoacyl-[acyl-carrier-protein] synthase III C-terminal domain-containing protein [Dehalococcoidia bacterium]